MHFLIKVASPLKQKCNITPQPPNNGHRSSMATFLYSVMIRWMCYIPLFWATSVKFFLLQTTDFLNSKLIFHLHLTLENQMNDSNILSVLLILFHSLPKVTRITAVFAKKEHLRGT